MPKKFWAFKKLQDNPKIKERRNKMEIKEDFENNIILKLSNISVKYHTPLKETVAIKNLSFNVYNKEFLTILGPSGCGKSTVLSLISNILPCTNGEITENIKETGSIQKIGYMLQKDYLFEWRTIEQNVILGLEIRKKLTEETKEYAINLLKKYGLGNFLNHYPYELSGGMRQKVSLIRTLAVKPQILLLDEPFSALDFQTRLNLSEEVLNIIKSENKTAILVTHDISEAISLSDRIIIFSKRPSHVKKTIKIEFDKKNLSLNEKRKNKKFNKYFDVIWGELDDKK